MTPMRIAAALASLAVLAGCMALIPHYPGFGLLASRGGLVMLGLSLAIANGMVWLSEHDGLSARVRLQLRAAGWIWIVVQGGAQLYLYQAAPA
jgi:hypothetical protein